MFARRPRQREPRRTRRRAGVPIGVAGVVLLAAALPATAAASCGRDDARAGALTGREAAQALRCLVNEERHDHGLAPVAPAAPLARAARGHARAMSARGFFAHGDVGRRVRSAGYDGPVGEALAWGAGSRSTPRALLDALLASPPHRAILLDGGFRDIGVGVARGAPDGRRSPDAVTVTLNLGTPA